MDTSIAFLLLAAVLFVVIVPTVLKRSAERDEEVLPDRVRTVDVDRAPRCATDDSRPRLLRDASHPAQIDLPAPAVETVPTAPQLSLRTSRPTLEVVDGDRTSAPDRGAPPGWDEEDVEAEALPMAAGQTAPLDLRSSHLTAVRSASGTADVLAFAPAHATLVASAGSADPETMDPSMTSSHRTAHRRVADAAERMPTALPADVRARLAQQSAGGPGRGASSGPSGGQGRPHVHHGSSSAERRRPAPARPTMDAASRKRVRTLRAVLPFCGLAVVGLALLTVVFTGFVVFGSMPWGVPVVTAALAAASLGLVRGLNKEIRALRRGAAEAPAGPAAPRPSADTRRPAERASATRTSAAGRTSAPAVVRKRAGAQDTGDQAPAARGSREVVATRAVVDVDELITADLPIVREDPAAADDAVGIEPSTRTEESTPSDEAPVGETATNAGAAAATDAGAAAEGTSAAHTASTRTRSIFAASAQTDGPSVAESLARRRAPGEWTPAVLPTPRYVDAPVAEREAPEPVTAEASSYSLTPANRESLAEQFAEELGYRPALTDAAREHAEQAAPPSREKATGSDGPLSHGRTAITGSGSAQSRSARRGTEDAPAQLGDILARRRA
ncbi:hypothetical protein [Brevibacterium yomogidense]|uniref:hypothetical protein n=1 Tax=Brevibacterium yomogidense TaxID=946573 RepID=UPI0018DFDF24|nr:hypothetical protein [Brevibacterium yomogidense]